MADTVTFSAALKEKAIGPIRDNLHRGKVLLFGDADANPEQFKGILASAENVDHVGNGFRIPLKAQRNQAVGFRFENEALPVPGSSEYTYLTEPLRFSYGRFSITGQLLKAAETGEGAFVSAFKQEMEDVTLSNKLDFNRAAYGDGMGNMGSITGNATGAVVPVTTTIGFRGGENVDIVTTATGVASTGNANRRIVAIDRAGLTVTLNAAPTTATTNAMSFTRSSTSSTVGAPNYSWGREIQGLSSIVSDTGSLHGIPVAQYPWWKSFVRSAVGPINDSVLRDAKDGVMFESGFDLETGLDFAIVTTRGIRRRYADTLTALKRFNDAQSVKLHGGFTALMFDENPIFVDDQCPVGNMFGLSINKLFWAQASDWEWMEKDGSVLDRTDRDSYAATLFKYCQLGTTARNGHFRLQGITDDVR